MRHTPASREFDPLFIIGIYTLRVATSTTRLTTFAEFEQLPDPKGGRYELRHGATFTVAPPKHDHYMVQQRLRDLLHRAAAGAGVVGTEFGFRPLPEYEYWFADVAFVSKGRADGIPLSKGICKARRSW